MSSSGSVISWIQWFCSNRGNDFFCEIDEDYVCDQFNLTGLTEFVPRIRAAIDKILDNEPDESENESMERIEEVEQNAEKLYGLIHARYILTNKGLSQMLEKWKDGEFGGCPRALCDNHPLMPIGLSDIPGEHMVKMFCSKCEDIYQPKHARHQFLDGAYFGTSFPEMLLMVHPELRRTEPVQKYVPRLYGFRIHPSVTENQRRLGEE